MRAIERNKKLYELLLSFTEKAITSNEVISYEDEDKLMVSTLAGLLYIKANIVKDDKGNDYSVYNITHKGWEFLESYEAYIERKRTNYLLFFIGVPAFFYYAGKIFLYAISKIPNCHN